MRTGSRSPAGLAIFALLVSSAAHASLGGTEASIESDRKVLQGRSETVAHPGYRIHEITIDGQKVREYVLPNGRVFAVSWRGPAQPNLSVLLGSYFHEYEDAVSRSSARRRGRGSRVIRSRNLVLERSGHMRDVRGKAYVPELLPEGFDPGDID